MKNREEKFVIDAEPQNYVNPPIPEGYQHVEGTWDTGFTIERSSDGSQFVWIPVVCLDANGTLDNGMSFANKFGRRNYNQDKFGDQGYNEEMEGQLKRQLGSIKKYKGFYISRYYISISEDGKPQSVRQASPKLKNNFVEAESIAAAIEGKETIQSHLPFGAEFDSMMEFVMAEARDTKDEGYINNIYFDRKIDEWTQEKFEAKYRVIRGDYYYYDPSVYSATYRTFDRPIIYYLYVGFRAALYIK